MLRWISQFFDGTVLDHTANLSHMSILKWVNYTADCNSIHFALEATIWIE